MGNPICTERYRREQVFKVTRAATSVIPALMKLLPWAAFSLCLRQAIGSNMDPFMEFDAAIDNCILSMAQLPSTLREDPGGVPWFFLLRSTPLALGGLGIPRQSGIDGETFPGRLRISSWSPTTPASSLGLVLIGRRPSILVVQRTSPSVASIHTRRSSSTHKTNFRRCFPSPGRCMYILDIADKPEVPLEQRRDEQMLWYRAASPNGVSPINARTIRRAAHKRRALLLLLQVSRRSGYGTRTRPAQTLASSLL